MDRQLGPLARRASVELDRHRNADAAAAAAPARLRPAHRKPRPVPQFSRPPQRGRIVAAVIDEAERIAVRHRCRRDEVAPPDLEAVEAVAAAAMSIMRSRTNTTSGRPAVSMRTISARACGDRTI